MVHCINEISTNIMERKIDINFIEQPLHSTARGIAVSETAILNFIRDLVWAPLTYLSVDVFLNRDESMFLSMTLTQTFISMIAMAIGAAFYQIIKSMSTPKDSEEEVESRWITLAKVLFIWVGAGLAIPGWNALQYVGNNIGLGLGLSKDNAGYFSSIFPGIPEGPIQGIVSLISSYTINKTWHHFNIRTFLEQLVIFATLGAIPGDIWQLAYQVITDTIDAYETMSTGLSILVLGFGLATAVYIGNVAFGTGYERIINRSHYTIELDIVEDSIDLKQDIIDESKDHLVSYNGRPGAPNKASIVILKHEHHAAV